MIVTITRSNTETSKRKRNHKVIFSCDKDGKYKEVDNATQSTTKKYGCSFKIKSTPSKDGSWWKIDVKYGPHDHNLLDIL